MNGKCENCENIEIRCRELTGALHAAFSAMDKLLEDKPLLGGKIYGSTTLGNVRAEIWGVLYRQE